MATVIEHDIHHSADDVSSSATAILAIVAIVLLVGLVLYGLRLYPGAATVPSTDTTGGSVQVDVNSQIPADTPPAGNPAY